MKKRLSVRIPRRHWAAAASCLFFAVSAALRLGYYLPREMDGFTLTVQLIMPVTAAAVFLAGMAAGGKWAKPAVIGATVLGVAFFLIKATTFTPVHQALCTLLYLGVLVLFCGTLLGLLPTKKLLYPLFGLPLLYHIFIEDTKAYFFADPPVAVVHWLPEISVLCIMAGLLALSVSLEVRKV